MRRSCQLTRRLDSACELRRQELIVLRVVQVQELKGNCFLATMQIANWRLIVHHVVAHFGPIFAVELIYDATALLAVMRLRVVAVSLRHIFLSRRTTVRIHSSSLTQIVRAWRFTRSFTPHDTILDPELLSAAKFALLVPLARHLNLLPLRLPLSVQVLLGILWWNDSVLTSLRLVKCHSLNGPSLLEDIFHFRLTLLMTADSDTRRHRHSPHLNWLLLWASGAGSSNLDGTTEECALVNLAVLWAISSGVRIYIVSLQILTVNATSDSWVCVAVTICMEGRLTKVSAQCRVSKPPRAFLQLLKLGVQLFDLFVSQLF